MDVARALPGQGWPVSAGPWNDDGVREVWRSQTRMQGQAFLVSFLAIEKRNSPGKAKQKPSAKLGNRLGQKPPGNS
jgi:hypothetical protein